jgi:hypothetical protein
VFTPSLIDETKFGVNQTIYHTANLSPVPFGFAVSGFSSLTGASTTDYPSKTFDLLDDLSWAKGRHIIKAGFETRWIQLNQGTSQSGTLTYTSTAAFLDNSMGAASYTAILPLVRQRKTQYWGYVQDEWKVVANLTITAGIRYNFFNALHAIGDNDVPFDFGTCGGYCPRTDSFFHPRYDDFDPRLGIAWAHGDTVLRAGAGIYHTDGQEDDQNLPISNTVERYAFSNTSFPSLSFPLTPFLQYAEAGGLGVVYQLPFGAGRRYLGSSGVARTVFVGWILSAIGTSQTGLPFNITIDRANGSVPGDYAISGEERPDYVFGVPLTPPGGPAPREWVNPAAFSTPASGTFGNLGRNAFRAPGISDVDLALAKEVSVAERMTVRFRADMFNALNRAQYGAPNADLSQVAFGTITTTISSYATGRGTPREFQLSAKISF